MRARLAALLDRLIAAIAPWTVTYTVDIEGHVEARAALAMHNARFGEYTPERYRDLLDAR